jgi:hypothetical protein
VLPSHLSYHTHFLIIFWWLHPFHINRCINVCAYMHIHMHRDMPIHNGLLVIFIKLQ